jgi:beta-mannosidase
MRPSPDHDLRDLSEGWQAARAAPDLHANPAGIDALDWVAARVPGTAALALQDAGLWRPGERCDFDAEDWWFRTSFEAEPALAGEHVRLHFDGIATVAEVFLNDERVLESDSMFATHAIDVGERLSSSNELAIRCRALGPLLGVRRRPRARWRTRLVADGNLRFFRTMLLGRCPGIAPGPAAVGPWRPVRLERLRDVDVDDLSKRPRLEGDDGVLAVRARLRALDGRAVETVEVELSGASGTHRARLSLSDARVPGGSGHGTGADDVAAPDGAGHGIEPGDAGDADGARALAADLVTAVGELRVPDVARWWPHTHGEPALHGVRLLVGGEGWSSSVDAGRVGFRELTFGARPEHSVEQAGLDLHVNGVAVFARGAVWTTADPVGLAPPDDDLRAALILVRDAGMNMLRVPGTGAYETPTFHDLCDELGILVWQDFMFANLDYPIADERFRTTVAREARCVLGDLAGRPSLTVLCGNSEVEQQVAMTGLDPALGRGELFGELLPELVRDSGVDGAFIPTAPCGGDLPFRPGEGVGTYYGVGCYRLPLEDARQAGVRFAAECLAFSHVPGETGIEEMAPDAPEQLVGHHPVWKAGIPRENGADWDFEDIRDHYLRRLFGVDAAELRGFDHARYLELSRMLTGEILAEVFGEWRRAASPCRGALVLWLHDLLPGAGWGLLDSRGRPKVAYHQLKRVLAPVAVWTTDEQLGGVVAHVANDRPEPLSAFLRVALYREREHVTEQARAPVELGAHSYGHWNVEAVVGHFVDAGWAYRFGPCVNDTIVVTLEQDGSERGRDSSEADQPASEPDQPGGEADQPAGETDQPAGETDRDADGDERTRARVLSQAMRFPAGWPLERETPEGLGLTAHARTGTRARALPDGTMHLAVSSRRLAYGVRVHAPGYVPSDDGFSIEPGAERILTLHPVAPEPSLQEARIGAVNMSGMIRIEQT